ncbi:hypothetical protein KY285_007627 [Solanum tuberosum]|nr:hypothetical protein KY289_007952 [Solanum tuberosum]KAH0745970.1 hypothetical protein KY285_007627 [Solanum tuberosum]
MPSGHEVHHYLERNDDHEGAQVMDTQSIGLEDDRGEARVIDTQAIESAYDSYLQSLVITETDTAPTFCRGPELARAGGGGIPSLHVRDPLPSAHGPELAQNGRRRPRETLPLPHGASNTLYIKGLPSDSSRREVARYKIDEHDHDSAYLRLQFSKFPGPRFGGSGSTRGKR